MSLDINELIGVPLKLYINSPFFICFRKNDMHPNTRKVLYALRLRRVFNGVFLKANGRIMEILKKVEPYITYEYAKAEPYCCWFIWSYRLYLIACEFCYVFIELDVYLLLFEVCLTCWLETNDWLIPDKTWGQLIDCTCSQLPTLICCMSPLFWVQSSSSSLLSFLISNCLTTMCCVTLWEFSFFCWQIHLFSSLHEVVVQITCCNSASSVKDC